MSPHVLRGTLTGLNLFVTWRDVVGEFYGEVWGLERWIGA